MDSKTTNPRATARSQDDSDIVKNRRTAKQRSAYRKTWPYCDRVLQAIPEHTTMDWTSSEPSTAEEQGPIQSPKLKRKNKVVFNSSTLQETIPEDRTEDESEEPSARPETPNTDYKTLPPVPSSKSLPSSTTSHDDEVETTAELRILRAQVVWNTYHLDEARVQERRLENRISELEKVCKSQARIVDKLSDQLNMWQTSHETIEVEYEEALGDIEEAKIYMGELELANASLRVQLSRMQEQTARRSSGSRLFGWLRTILTRRLFRRPEGKTP